ncbi:hypothetical protein LQZ18_03345 [Lachnospiraceae bacterium ZAX-1]
MPLEAAVTRRVRNSAMLHLMQGIAGSAPTKSSVVPDLEKRLQSSLHHKMRQTEQKSAF